MRAPKRVAIDRPPHHIWEEPDMEWLEHQYLELGKSARAIAAGVGCSDWKAQQWVRAAGWRKPVKVSDDPLAPMRIGRDGGGIRFVGVTREWLYQEYVEKDKSTVQIAAEVGATNYAVWKWLLKHSISIRTRDELSKRHSERMSGEGNPAWKDGSTIKYHKNLALRSYPNECGWCATPSDLQVHHRDHDRSNGAVENLSLLCGSCNRLEAQLWALEKKELATWEYQDGQLIVQFMEVTK